ncbi:MAG: folate-binding protein [Cyanobacteria bacterium P01_D01_bin.73]
MAELFNALRTLQGTQNAVFGNSDASSSDAFTATPLTYDNDADAKAALSQGTVIVDRTHWTRLEVTGDDRLSFLHNQTTQDFKTRQPGQGCLAVVVTAAARIIDLTFAAIASDSVLMLASPEMGDRLASWFDRYIFPMDRVTFTDHTNTSATFTLLGSTSHATLEQLGFSDVGDMAPYDHQSATINGYTVRAIAYSGLARPGYTLWTDAENAAPLWKALTDIGAVPAGETLWDIWRIEDGVPKQDNELTDSYNPLEAGLWQAVSINKGCYIGQEIIARLNTYDGVQQCLYGVQLDSLQPPGTKLINAKGDRAGTITSSQNTGDGAIALAYIRRKQCEVGASFAVTAEQTGETGTIADIPFSVRSNPADKDKPQLD